MAYSDRELLARIIQCEAGGEGDNGMKAVATVTLNRVNSTEGEYARVSQGGNIRFPSNGSGTFHTRLGKHCFYRPTSRYSQT